MASRDCESEIQELRKQIEMLAAQQPEQKESVDNQPEEEELTADETVANVDFSELREKIDGFVEMLQEDLKRSPATTAVVIFSLGVLMGRLMAR